MCSWNLLIAKVSGTLGGSGIGIGNIGIFTAPSLNKGRQSGVHGERDAFVSLKKKSRPQES